MEETVGRSNRPEAGGVQNLAVFRTTVGVGRGIHGRMVSMNLDQSMDLVRSTLILALVISAPMLIIGLLVGVTVSLLQAVTQIQEQTLSFVPKIVAMVGAAIILMPWISHRLIEYSHAIFINGPNP
jgi:flagellar biosynthetic protein FliQ